MKSKKYFEEEQKYKHFWVWLILIPFLTFLIVLLNKQYKIEEVEMNNLELLLVIGINVIIMVGLVYLFSTMRLIIQVRSDGFFFKYPPFKKKFFHFAFDEIDHAEIRDYHPIKEFGGHGFKKTGRKKGESYTVSGKKGIQIYLKSGKKILVGTQRPDALKSAMEKMARRNENV